MAGQEIASFYASIGADTKDFKKGLDETKTGMSSLEKSSSAIGTATKLAMGVGVAAVAGFGAVIGKSIGAAADMEQGVADIGAMMNLTADDTAKLGKHIMDLGLDPKLKVSATEAAGAVQSLGTAGLSMEQIMGGASKATVLLANATGLSGSSGFASAASIATDVMAQFNIEAKDLDKAVSGIAGTTVASKFTIDDYRLALAQAGGVASSVGVGFDDFNAAIAATSSSFAGGSDAGTSFKVFLQQLAPTTDKAKEAMKDFGLTTALSGEKAASTQKELNFISDALAHLDPSTKGYEKKLKDLTEQQAKLNDYLKLGQNAFFDEHGSMKSMTDIAGLLQSAFGGLSDEQASMAAKTIFGTDAMRTAFALAKGGPEIIDKMKESIGNVNAEELAAKRMDTFKGAMEIAQGVIETLSISIGQAFLPVLRPLVELFSTLATKYGPVVVAFFQQVAQALTNWIKPMTDALKGTEGLTGNLKIMWDMAAGVVEVIQRFIKPLTDAITKFFSWKDILAAVGLLLAGPVLAAIVSVVSGLVTFLAPILAVVVAVAALRNAWEHDFLGIRTITQNAFAELAKWFESSGIWKGSIRETLYGHGGIQPTILIWSTYTQNRIAEWVQMAKDKFEGWKNDVIQTFTVWRDRLLTIWQVWTGPAIKAISDWAAVTKSHFENWVGWIVGDFGVLTKMKKKAFEIWESLLGWWEDHIQPWINYGRDAIQGLWDGIKSKWNSLSSWFEGVWGTLTNKFKSFFGLHSPSTLFAGYGEDMMAGLAQGLEGGSGMVEDAMTKAFGKTAALENAVGSKMAGDILANVGKYAADAMNAFQQGNVAPGNKAYDIAKMVIQDSDIANGVGISALKRDIDALVQALGETGAGHLFGRDAKEGLSGTSDYLGALMGSITAGQTAPSAPSAPGGSVGGGDVLGVLQAILAALLKNGQIEEKGYSDLGGLLTRMADPRYGSVVSYTAALAR